jgi:PAS domain S-box-containing protein
VRFTLGLALAGYLAVASYDQWMRDVDAVERAVQWLTTVALLVAFAWALRAPRLGGVVGIVAVGAELLFSVAREGEDPSAKLVIPTLIAGAGLLLGERAAILAGVVFGGGAVGLAFAFAPPGFSTSPLLMRPVLVLAVVAAAAAVLTRSAARGQRRALEASESAHRRFLDLFQNAPDGLLALDSAGRVLEANPLATEMLGAGPLPGRSLDALLVDRGARSTRRPVEGRAEAPAVVEIGSGPATRTLEVTARVVEERAGEGPSWLLVLRDTTERRALEEQLLHAQRLETVGMLAGGVAHDFNNLLTAIGGNAEMLCEDERPEVRELASEIADAQRRGSALTRQLLAFARRDARKPEPMDLAAALRDMERLLARILGERNPLLLACDGEAPVVADRAQIEQVVVNLVTNARDASPAGVAVSVRVRAVGREEGRALGASRGGNAAVLEVSDRGTGMSMETRARIFEPFFTTKVRGQGTGLGLSTVHGIVAQSGGQLAVETAPGRGSTFRVFLPLSAGSPWAEAPALTPLPTPGTGERVLVVEDDPGVRGLVQRVLRGAGYAVTVADSGREALRLATEAAAPHLLVTDMAMPGGMDGPEVARRLLERFPAMAVVLMTGYFEADEAQAPVPGVLRKPFTPEELLRRARQALERREVE